MPFNKKIRQIVLDKYNSHCAYCGCEIDMKTMQVDHYLSQRNFVRHIKNQYQIPAQLLHLKETDVNHIDNLMPSCRSCNNYKAGNPPEAFRDALDRQYEVLRNNNPMIRLCERYGIITVHQTPINFYFETNL